MDLELSGKAVLITGWHRRTRAGLGEAAARRGRIGGGLRPRSRNGCAPPRPRCARSAATVLAQRADVTRVRQDLDAFVDGRHRALGPDRRGRPQRRAAPSAGPIQSDRRCNVGVRLPAQADGRRAPDPPGACRSSRATRGSILFTLAISAKAPGGSSEPSSVTRAAGMALMKALSKELAPDGVRANAVLIGLIESGQWVRAAEGDGAAARAVLRSASPRTPAIPLGRFGRAEEFADLGCFLLSPRASYLTGRGDQPRRGAFAGRLTRQAL